MKPEPVTDGAAVEPLLVMHGRPLGAPRGLVLLAFANVNNVVEGAAFMRALFTEPAGNDATETPEAVE